MLTSAKHQILQRVFDRFFTWRVSEFTGSQLIALDYPVAPRPRYSPATAAHPELWAWFDRQRGSCEQYLLACWILANRDCLRLVASNVFASYDAALRASVVRLIGPTKLAYMLEPAFNYGLVPGLLGLSIWFETVGRG